MIGIHVGVSTGGGSRRPQPPPSTTTLIPQKKLLTSAASFVIFTPDRFDLPAPEERRIPCSGRRSMLPRRLQILTSIHRADISLPRRPFDLPRPRRLETRRFGPACPLQMPAVPARPRAKPAASTPRA